MYKDELIELFREKAIKHGDFTLASGQKSNYYIDSKQVTLSGRGLLLINYCLHDLVSKIDFKAMGGMELGAVPIAVSYVSWVGGGYSFIIRKEVKNHGTQKRIEGVFSSGDKVVVVEDVSTTGRAIVESIQVCREVGLEVVKAITLVDREQGAKAAVAKLGVELISLLSLN